MEWTKTKDADNTNSLGEKVLTTFCFPFKGEGGNDGVVNPHANEYPKKIP